MPPMQPQRFPVDVSEITVPWLNAVLRDAGALGGATVVSYEAEGVKSPGLGSRAFTLELGLDTALPSAPRTVVVKFASSDTEVRKRGAPRRKTEINFYKEFGAGAGIPLPVCYFAEIDMDTGHFAILLEDLSPGWVGGDIQWSPELHIQVLDHMARFHAKWWESQRIRDTSWLTQPDDATVYGPFGSRILEWISTAEDRYPENFVGYIHRVAQRMADDWERVWPLSHGQEVTLVHGDFHAGQLFVPSDVGGRFALFDWEDVRIAPAGTDLGRFMLLTLSIDELRNQDSIAAYHQRLVSHGVSYPLERFRRDTRREMAFIVLTVLNVVNNFDVDIVAELHEQGGGSDWRQSLFGEMSAKLELFDVLGAL